MKQKKPSQITLRGLLVVPRGINSTIYLLITNCFSTNYKFHHKRLKHWLKQFAHLFHHKHKITILFIVTELTCPRQGFQALHSRIHFCQGNDAIISTPGS